MRASARRARSGSTMIQSGFVTRTIVSSPASRFSRSLLFFFLDRFVRPQV